MYGEFVGQKLAFMQTQCKGTELDVVVSVVKECLRDIYPNLPIFPLQEEYKTCGIVVEEGVSSPQVKLDGFEYDKKLLNDKRRSTKLNHENWRIGDFFSALSQSARNILRASVQLMHVSINTWVFFINVTHVILSHTTMTPSITTSVLHTKGKEERGRERKLNLEKALKRLNSINLMMQRRF